MQRAAAREPGFRLMRVALGSFGHRSFRLAELPALVMQHAKPIECVELKRIHSQDLAIEPSGFCKVARLVGSPGALHEAIAHGGGCSPSCPTAKFSGVWPRR